jgi:hypothetical protein
MMISDEMVENIKRNKPEDIATQAEVDELNYYFETINGKRFRK